ncbi:LysM domain-containing protein [Porticoccus sp.]|uniref:LysM peptidoglycan-binding domain-containing protein n=1 Tax=Porticoccus sp. TaxID=2024853 RepID=UPI000C5C5690|nr:LysM domain-containing protein [Porticoccus sp.]MAZ70066.1 peptidoglycan-binding protein [Porticoccus sp.]|tara:strand:- start:36928 stop:37947 length:1020 start_codon:yes stop_codon:yes gene_type:complete
MKKTLLGIVAACAIAIAAIAAEAPFNEDVPEKYTVKKGDTLWDISDLYLRDPWLWPEIWYANPQIANPHLIYPGDIISMVYIDGRPRLMLEKRDRRVKLSPEVKVVPESEAIPALPLDIINSFLTRNRIVTQEEVDRAPYVVAGHEKKLLSGSGDTFYARGQFDETPTYGLYRVGEPYLDPVTQEILGIRAQDVGSAKVQKVADDIATMLATRSLEEVRIGERLLPHEERPLNSIFYPSAPDSTIEGEIMAVEGGITQVGHLDVVSINRGEREGLEAGNILAIFKRGEEVTDYIAKEKINLPNEQAGLLMIFRAFEKMSYGLVIKAERPLAVNDIVKNP